uniref:DNA-directed RNA polymerase subunit beta'' n=2 Tax=cellular organisms TaxID=131567 RepID=A0A097KP63_9CHLO|nr:beta'' subunit of RNA polymerase [Paradoxia multiseta]AIT94955.1 beta'' subunit of RNA polymerase [Paradoxia multiseta]
MALNPLFLNQCFDKNRLKNLITWSLLTVGEKRTIETVENLKALGFQFATQAGVSLGVDDLKIPHEKLSLVSQASQQVEATQQAYRRGDLTAIEKLQQLVDTWHRTSETLKQTVVNHFQSTDKLSPVYMMAFSGARGNISQVRQLAGMRGLMADPQGQIIGFPIRSNFREGLTLTEYMISCYGARKGLVDTALRTADAGYLTRRLIDVSQHMIVKAATCATPKGIVLKDLQSATKVILPLRERLIGRVLAEDVVELSSTTDRKGPHSPSDGTPWGSMGWGSWGGSAPPRPTTPGHRGGGWAPPENTYEARPSRGQLPLIGNQDILSETSSYLRESRLVASRNQEISGPLASRIASCRDSVAVRSPLTCSIRHGVCQLCYGWSLSEGRLVTLGEAVGIIAAQSIGEPGTQLTMRTFHTGGVFSGDVMAEIRAPHDGVVDFPQPLQGLLIRTSHGRIAFLTKAPGVLLLGNDRSLAGAGLTGVQRFDERVRLWGRALLDSKQCNPPIAERAVGRGVASHGGPYPHAEPPQLPHPIEPRAIEGEGTRFSLESLTVLFVRQHEKVARTQLLAEFSSMGTDVNETIEAKRTLFSEMVGQVSFANVSVGTRLRESGDILQVSRNLGFIWILSGRRSPIAPLLIVYGKGSHLVNQESLVARVASKEEWDGNTPPSMYNASSIHSRSKRIIFDRDRDRRVVAKSESCQTDLTKRGHNITDQHRGLLDAFSTAAPSMAGGCGAWGGSAPPTAPSLRTSTSMGDHSDDLATTQFKFLPNLRCWAILSPPGRKNRIEVPSHQPNVSLSPDCLLFRSFSAGRALQNYQQQERFLSAAVLVQNSSLLSFKGDPRFEEGEPKTTRSAIRRTRLAVGGRGSLGWAPQGPTTRALQAMQGHRGGPHSRTGVRPGQQSRKRPTWTGAPSSSKTSLGREDQGEIWASNPDFYWFPGEQRSGESGLAWVDSRYIAKGFTHGEIIWINEQNQGYHGTRTSQVSPKQKLPQRSNLAGLSTRWPGLIGLTGVPRSAGRVRRFAERVTTEPSTTGLHSRGTISTELWNPFPSEAAPSKPAVLQKQHDSLPSKRSCYNTAEFRKEELVGNQRQYFISIGTGWRERPKKDTTILGKLDDQVPGVATRPIINFQHSSVTQSTNPLASLYALGNQPDTRLGRKFQRRGRSLEKTDKKEAAQFGITNSTPPFSLALEASHQFSVPTNGLNKGRNQRWEGGGKVKEERLHALHLKTRPGWVYWAHDQANFITFHESTQFCSENRVDNLFFEPSLAYFEAFKNRQFSYSIADNLFITSLRIELLELGLIEEDINGPRPFEGLALQASQGFGVPSDGFGVSLNGWPTNPGKETTTLITTRGSLFSQLATQPAPEPREGGSFFSTNKWTSHEFVSKSNQISGQYLRPRLKAKPRIWPLGQQVLLLLRKMLWLSQNFTPPLANVDAAVGALASQASQASQGFGVPSDGFGVPSDSFDTSLNPSILAALSRIRTVWRGQTPCYRFNSRANAYQLRFLKNLVNRKPFLWLRGFPVQIQVVTNQKTRHLVINPLSNNEDDQARKASQRFGVSLNGEANTRSIRTLLEGTPSIERGLTSPSPIRSEFLLPYGFSFGLAGRCLPASLQLRQKYIGTETALLGQNAEPAQRNGKPLGGRYKPWATTWLRARRIVQATESSTSCGKVLPPQDSSSCVSQSRRRWFFGPALEKPSLLLLVQKGSPYPLSILEKSKAIFLRRYKFAKISINKRSNGLPLHLLSGNSFTFSTKQASTRLISDTPSIGCNVAPVVPFKSFQTAFLPNPLYWIRFAGYLSLPPRWSGVRWDGAVGGAEPPHAPQPLAKVGVAIEPVQRNAEPLGGKGIPSDGFEISLNGSSLHGAGSAFRWTDWPQGSKAGKRGWLSPLRERIVPLLSPSVGELVSQGNSHPKGKKPAESDNGENLHGQANWQPGASRTGRNILFTQADYASFVSEGGNPETYVGEFVSIGDEIVAGYATPTSGQIVALEGNKITLRRTQALLFYAQGIMHVNHDEWVEKNAPILTLTYQKLVTGDIVQGIPKIEQFFEAPATKEGEPLSNSLQSRLRRSFQKLKQFYPIPLAVKKSLEEIQQILVEGILKVYLSQGVRIADKHLEIVIRQMISKGQVLDVGNTGLFQGEHVRLDRIERINLATYGEKADYEPAVLGITQASLDSESFISAASFQETTRVLSRDTIRGKTDFLRGLKERVVLGDLIQAGTGVDDNINYGLLFGIAPTYQGTVSSLF